MRNQRREAIFLLAVIAASIQEKGKTMSARNLPVRTQNNGTRAWKYDDSPMPPWLDDFAGDLQPNGTFSLPTDAGLVRVHPG
ncbi:MAG TPA: hypothetical protein VJQ52_05425 [Steroidobacteraceae bacterium]|nr:hypothetical protein [Steroidobacteraceae bacterium]